MVQSRIIVFLSFYPVKPINPAQLSSLGAEETLPNLLQDLGSTAFSEWANARILLNGKPLFPCGVVHCYCKCFLHLADVHMTFEGLLYLLHRPRKKNRSEALPWVIHYCPFWTNVVDIEWYPANFRNKVVLWGQGFFRLHLFGVMSCGRYDSPRVMIALTGTLRQALRSASHWWNYTYLHKIAWS